MNTKLTLDYRDEDGWNKFIEVVFAGEITSKHVTQIEKGLIENEFFLANQLGLPSPQLQPVEGDDFPSDSDHAFCHFSELQQITNPCEVNLSRLLTNKEPTVDMSIQELADSIETIEWDIDAELNYLGLNEPFSPNLSL